ncbi:MAG: ATP-binding protein [Micrococcaceae bacterium]
MTNKKVKRRIKKEVIDALSFSKIVYVQGARQVGKSTLVQEIGEELKAIYITLDDDDMLQQAKNDPKSLLKINEEGVVIIDEVQLAPELWRPLKMQVDSSSRKGQFLLTGSTYTLTSSRAPDSLAGRIVHFELDPLSQNEIHETSTRIARILDIENPNFKEIFGFQSNISKQEYYNYALTGGYPEVIFSKNLKQSRRYLKNYIQSLLSKDQESFGSYKPVDNLTKAFELLASGTCQEFVKTEFSKALGMNNNTGQEYLDVFEKLFLVRSLPGWSISTPSKIVKRPKILFNDSGLAASIANVNLEKFNPMLDSGYNGQLFETFAINEILRQLHITADLYTKAYHYRDKNKHEIDLILENSEKKLICIEIKSSATAYNAEKHIKWFANYEKYKKYYAGGIVFYTGDKVVPLSNNIWKIPLSYLWA